jgi:hypothetical protein
MGCPEEDLIRYRKNKSFDRICLCQKYRNFLRIIFDYCYFCELMF